MVSGRGIPPDTSADVLEDGHCTEQHRTMLALQATLNRNSLSRLSVWEAAIEAVRRRLSPQTAEEVLNG
jgi:PIN domain nuclease of toxin-antitoxin system